jgi:hypothetical protein
LSSSTILSRSTGAARWPGRGADDQLGGELDVEGVDLAPVDEAEQELDPHPGHLFQGLAHGRHPGDDGPAEVQVVEARDRQVARDPQASLGGRLHRADGDLVVEGDDGGRRLGQRQQGAGRLEAVGEGGLAAQPDQLAGREQAVGGQGGAVPHQAAVGRDPVERAGDGRDPGMPEPEQVRGCQLGAGEVRGRDRGDVRRQRRARVDDHERVPAGAQVGQHRAGLGREDEDGALGELGTEQFGQAGLVSFERLGAQQQDLPPLAQAPRDRGEDRTEVVVEHVRAADRDDVAQRARGRPPAAGGQAVPLDRLQDDRAGGRRHGGTVVEHPRHGGGGDPGLRRDLADGGARRRRDELMHEM